MFHQALLNVPLPDASSLAVFTVAALVLLVIPGPSVLYIVAQSVSRGRMAGLVSMLGIQGGAVLHVAAATAGLSALLVRSSVAFSIVKYVGAGYLVFLGLMRLFGRDEGDSVGPPQERSLLRLFAQGVVVNMLNPKTALFFFAFLPQFVDVSKGGVAFQIAILGLVFVLLAVVSDGVYALAAGSAAGWFRGRRGALRAQRWASGGVLLGLGVATAFSGAHRNK
jgi:threonine/homoserine/homoserine lactone efflux protein